MTVTPENLAAALHKLTQPGNPIRTYLELATAALAELGVVVERATAAIAGVVEQLTIPLDGDDELLDNADVLTPSA